MPQHFDLLYTRRMDKKCTFNTHAMGDAAHSKVLVDATTAQAHNHTLERL